MPDARFEPRGDWPIAIDVQAEAADDWMAHLNAECFERAYSLGSVSQSEAEENSGTISITLEVGTIQVVWERKRDRDLAIAARVFGAPVATACELFDAVNVRVAEKRTTTEHRRGYLTYERLPWRGELWLSDSLRLGPASRSARSSTQPQIIVVDARVAGIGAHGVAPEFHRLLTSLRLFLSVTAGLNVSLPSPGWAWTYQFAEDGAQRTSELRPLGYFDAELADDMPAVGSAPSVPLREVQRPGLERSGMWPDDLEQSAPADIVELWGKFVELDNERRQRFLRAANAYCMACSMWPHQQTAYVAFLVVACETLKPTGTTSDKWNVYKVVKDLLGKPASRTLQRLSIPPQDVRSKYFHRGELAAGELGPMLLGGYFDDPSFRDTASKLSPVARMCLIEWIRRGGV